MRRSYRHFARLMITGATLQLVATLGVSANVEGQQPSERWRLVVEGQIGSESKGRAYQFTRIVSIAVDPRGFVYVADAGSRDIRVFDAAGVFVRAIGREGEGPGEFQYLRRAGLLATLSGPLTPGCVRQRGRESRYCH